MHISINTEQPPVVRTDIRPLADRQQAAAYDLERALFAAASTGDASAYEVLCNQAINGVGKLTLRESLTCAETLARLWAATGCLRGRNALPYILFQRASEMSADDPARARVHRWEAIGLLLELANEGDLDATRNLFCFATIMADEGDETAAELVNHISEQFPAEVASAADADARTFIKVEPEGAEASK